MVAPSPRPLVQLSTRDQRTTFSREHTAVPWTHPYPGPLVTIGSPPRPRTSDPLCIDLLMNKQANTAIALI
jgi:hypothetical protein